MGKGGTTKEGVKAKTHSKDPSPVSEQEGKEKAGSLGAKNVGHHVVLGNT